MDLDFGNLTRRLVEMLWLGFVSWMNYLFGLLSAKVFVGMRTGFKSYIENVNVNVECGICFFYFYFVKCNNPWINREPTDEQQRALPNIEQERVAAEQERMADGRINILAEFLVACPNSVEDLTIQDETALHIAVKSKNEKAVAIILGCIRRIGRKRVLDYKDKEGNTALHMVVSTSQDVIARSLRSAGALKSSSPDPSLAEFLNSPDRFSEELFKLRFLLRRSVSIELRNIGLVVAALIATAIFQAVLSPPGGVGDPGDNLLTNASNINATVSSTTNNLFATNTSFINATLFVPSDDPGKRLLFKGDNPGLVTRLLFTGTAERVTYGRVFLRFYCLNTCAFVLSMLMIMFALPFRPFAILHLALYFLMGSYGHSFPLISPSDVYSLCFMELSVVCAVLIFLARFAIYAILVANRNKRLEMLELTEL